MWKQNLDPSCSKKNSVQLQFAWLLSPTLISEEVNIFCHTKDQFESIHFYFDSSLIGSFLYGLVGSKHIKNQKECQMLNISSKKLEIYFSFAM